MQSRLIGCIGYPELVWGQWDYILNDVGVLSKTVSGQGSCTPFAQLFLPLGATLFSDAYVELVFCNVYHGIKQRIVQLSLSQLFLQLFYISRKRKARREKVNNPPKAPFLSWPFCFLRIALTTNV
jgi:hypothetical protein